MYVAKDAKDLSKKFGKGALVMLVRPDKYVGFMEAPGRKPRLAEYMRKIAK